MDLTKFEICTLHQKTDCSLDTLSANAFVSVNVSTLLGQAVFPWESENSSSPYCSPSATIPLCEGQNFLSEEQLHPNPFLKLFDIARDNVTSVDALKIKGILDDAKSLVHSKECKQETGDCEDGGIMGLKKEKEHFSDISLYSVKSPTSDPFGSLGNSFENQLNSCRQFTNAKNASNKTSTDSTQGYTIRPNVRIHESLKELNTKNQLPNSRDVSRISEKEKLRTDFVCDKGVQSISSFRDEEDHQFLGFQERGNSEQSNSLKKPQGEAAPGWKKPPRPPRSTKHDANSNYRKQSSNNSHSCKAKKLETLHSRRKLKAEGCSPNLTLFLAILFTFCFCLLIAISSK